MARSKKKSASNVINDPAQSLQTFSLLDLQQYTQEKTFATGASVDFNLFYAGRDDIHSILKYVLSRVSLITLDKSQASGAHEKALLASDAAKYSARFNTSIVVG